jgi:hypothetical protein
MNLQEKFDIVSAIARKYDIPVVASECYGGLILQSFASTPMIEELQEEFSSVYYSGEQTHKELRGLTLI